MITPEAVIETLLEARDGGDLALAVACYEPDAVIVARPGEIGCGKAAIQAFVSIAANLRLAFAGRSFLVGAGIARHQAAWRTTAGGQDLSGVSADILRQQADGTWRIALDNAWGGDPPTAG